MKYIIAVLISMFFIGCSSKQSEYLLPKADFRAVKSIITQIVVIKVKVPDYLNDDKILVKKGLEVKSLNANFADAPDKLFTQQTITTLKQALNNPNVFLYPWDVKSKKGYIVKIVLDDFIYSDSQVHLSGSYFIKLANGTTVSAKNFNLQTPSSQNPQDIMKNLGELYNRVVLQIAREVK